MLRRLRLPEGTPAEVRRAIVRAGDEARSLSHPHILPTLAVRELKSEIRIVYGHVDAEPLSALLSGEVAVPVGVALRIAVDLLDGLEGVHQAPWDPTLGPPFGGLTPSSVLVCANGVTKLCNLSLASRAATLEALGKHPDKLAYSAPEQIRRSAPVAARSDLFSAGVILWELLSGRRMLEGEPAEMERRLVAHDLPPISIQLTDSRGSARRLEGIVRACLAQDPEKRPESSRHVAEQLRHCAHLIATREEMASFLGERFPRGAAAPKPEQPPPAAALGDRPVAASVQASEQPARPSLGARREPHRASVSSQNRPALHPSRTGVSELLRVQPSPRRLTLPMPSRPGDFSREASRGSDARDLAMHTKPTRVMKRPPLPEAHPAPAQTSRAAQGSGEPAPSDPAHGGGDPSGTPNDARLGLDAANPAAAGRPGRPAPGAQSPLVASSAAAPPEPAAVRAQPPREPRRGAGAAGHAPEAKRLRRPSGSADAAAARTSREAGDSISTGASSGVTRPPSVAPGLDPFARALLGELPELSGAVTPRSGAALQEALASAMLAEPAPGRELPDRSASRSSAAAASGAAPSEGLAATPRAQAATGARPGALAATMLGVPPPAQPPRGLEEATMRGAQPPQDTVEAMFGEPAEFAGEVTPRSGEALQNALASAMLEEPDGSATAAASPSGDAPREPRPDPQAQTTFDPSRSSPAEGDSDDSFEAFHARVAADPAPWAESPQAPALGHREVEAPGRPPSERPAEAGAEVSQGERHAFSLPPSHEAFRSRSGRWVALGAVAATLAAGALFALNALDREAPPDEPGAAGVAALLEAVEGRAPDEPAAEGALPGASLAAPVDPLGSAGGASGAATEATEAGSEAPSAEALGVAEALAVAAQPAASAEPVLEGAGLGEEPHEPELAEPEAKADSPSAISAELLEQFGVKKLGDEPLRRAFALESQQTAPRCEEQPGSREQEKSAARNSKKAVRTARRAIARGEMQVAHDQLCAALALRESNFDALRALAELALDTGDPARAMEIVEAGLAVRPRDKLLRGTFGDALAMLGDIEQARHVWLRLTGKNSARHAKRVAKTYRGLGKRAFKARSWAQARTYYRRALVLDSRNADASRYLAEVLLEMGENRAGLLWAGRAAGRLKRSWRAQMIYGDALAKSGDAEGARVAWEFAQRLYPKSSLVRRRLRSGLHAAEE